MKKIYTTLLALGTGMLFSQQVSWQKNFESGTQDFLSGLSVTLDGQYLLSGSSIQSRSLDRQSAGSHNQRGKADY